MSEEFYTGWVDLPDEVTAVAQTLPFPVFGDTAADLLQDNELPKEWFLMDFAKKVTGGNLKVEQQGNVGTCVSFGCARSIEYTNCVEIVLGDQEEFKYLNRPVIYGGSRVEVGGGRLSGDGSLGVWAAKFVRDWGVLAQEKYGNFDLTLYSPAICRDYGKNGVPKELEELAKNHPITQITCVENWTQAKKALYQGYGISICSGQGFTMSRNADGVATPRGTWQHCMALTAFCTIKDKEYGLIENSWGSAHTGPLGPGEPNGAGFWASASVIDNMLSKKDSWAHAGLKGFQMRKIDWRSI